jgi:hypothetical protein
MIGCSTLSALGSSVNVVNVGERYKNVTFTTYLHETTGLVNVVNVARGFFTISRTWHTKVDSCSWLNRCTPSLVSRHQPQAIAASF